MNVNLDAKYELYINGQWVAPSGGKYFTTTNPATGEKLDKDRFRRDLGGVEDAYHE